MLYPTRALSTTIQSVGGLPLVMGLPRPETVARAKRGEVILGGCVVSGFEPKYYLIW
jgi:hypothetical protein